MLEFKTIKAVTIHTEGDGKQKERRYIQVDKPVKGFEGREIFHRQINCNFIEMLVKDEHFMEALKGMIPAEDDKPIIFEVVASNNKAVDRVHELKLTRYATLFGSQQWRGVIANYHNEAWLVCCTNNPC